MKQELYACIHAAEFPAQALLRLHTELDAKPVAVLEGRVPTETVCSLNRAAQMKGAALGMTRLEAESIPELRLLARSLETEAAARAVMLECAAHFSPRIEAASPRTGASVLDSTCAYVLDIAGTDRLFGPPEILARRLRTALASAGFRVSVAVSTNFHAARFKAASTRGITVIPDLQEVDSLTKLPIALLGLSEEHAETFAIWGIRTLGELAALEETDLVTRLGPQAAAWRQLALGALPHTFQPIEAEFSLKEFCDFETPVEETESLLFIGARMIDCLVARAASHALSLASLSLHMQLAGSLVYQRTIRPAIPTTDRKFLLKLLQLEIAAHPPHAAVLSLTITAQAGQSSKVQLGLFAPQTPEPSRLDVTIARLKAIAGEDRVGSPVLEDSHRPGSFRMETFTVVGSSKMPESPEEHRPRLALRRMRPPVPVRVQLLAFKPVAFRDRDESYKVAAAYGPWKTSGCWWSTDGWNSEEWDVLAETSNGSSVACLLVHNCAQNEWCLEAFYD
jgi:protein ImuB